MIESFRELGLDESILRAVIKKGFEEPTPVQKAVIPLFLREEKDIIAQAQTGTGKTAAFGLPLIHLLKECREPVSALVLTPTRELALQVHEELASFAENTSLKIGLIYGGQSYTEQLRRLKQGVQIVVGTPGRLLDLVDKGKLELSNIRYLILDEADEMLNLGFLDDVERIIGLTPSRRRILLFSATIPQAILEVSRKFMADPHLVKIATPLDQSGTTSQIYYEVEEKDKFEALCRIIDSAEDFYAIVFCRTKIEVDELAQRLVQRGYDADCLHGDLSQSQRELTLKKFRDRRITTLVATDVAARGIDILDLTHVINFHLPQDSESYIHRIGRTGRAGKSGTAITLITPAEFRRFRYLQKDSRQEMVKHRLPDVSTILKIKKQRIQNEIAAKLKDPIPEAIREWSLELQESFPDENLLAGVLALAFEDQLNPSIYQPIDEIRHTPPILRNGEQESARLYLSLGREHGYSPRKIVELIKERAGTRDHKISDICVLDKGTYLSVPLREAEFILRKMQGLVRREKSGQSRHPQRPWRPRKR